MIDKKYRAQADFLSHNRPIHELLKPNLLDQRTGFEAQFKGMAKREFTYEEFEQTREKLILEINKCLTEKEREFILDFMDCCPDYDQFPVKNLKDLPAVQWKYKNIENLKRNNKEKYDKMLSQLIEIMF